MRKKAIVNLLVKSKGPRYRINMSKPVKAHLNRVYLHNVKFKVSEAGRQRVIKEQRKNVHAFAIGVIGPPSFELWGKDSVSVSYNPYKYSTFVTSEGESIHSAPMACLENRKITAWI